MAGCGLPGIRRSLREMRRSACDRTVSLARRACRLPPAPSQGCPRTLAITPPAASAAVQAGQRHAVATTPAAGPPCRPGAARSRLSQTRLQIAPIVGASVEAATPLTERICQTRAKQRGICASPAAPTRPSTHVLKGYFSAISEGKRHHRHLCLGRATTRPATGCTASQGQEKAPGSGAEGWAAVSRRPPCRRSPTRPIDQLAGLAWRLSAG